MLILRHLFLLVLFCFALALPKANAQLFPGRNNQPAKPDTNSIIEQRSNEVDSLTKSKSNSLLKTGDSTLVDTLKKKQVGDLKTTVKYVAEDSMVFDVKNKTFYLYKKSKVNYDDISLAADRIKVNWETSIMYSNGVKDSTGKNQGLPLFVQNSDKYVAETIKYNFKTKKGIVSGIVTQQGEGYLHGDSVKRNPDNTLYVSKARYTTCNLEHPHFHIQATKIKMIPNDKLVAGPFNLHINNIPTPLAFPFGFFPTPQKQSAGIIIPTYGEAQELGFFLRDGGYYIPIGDYAGVQLLGSIYTKGSYGLGMRSQYRKRYAYEGSNNIQYYRYLRGDEGLQTKSDEYTINWSHNPQSKGPGRFSMGININSAQAQTRFSTNNNNRISTAFNSTIKYSRNPVGKPFYYSADLTYSQNTSTGTATLTLPQFNFAVNRQQPFKPKNGGTPKTALHKLGVTYSLSANNRINNAPRTAAPFIAGVPFFEDRFIAERNPIAINPANFGVLMRRADIAAEHTLPITTTFSALKYLAITPNFTYSEGWMTRGYNYRQVNDSTLNVDTVNRFTRAFRASGSLTATTRIFGTFFVKRGRLEAIRHTIVPSFGFSFTPDLTSNALGMYDEFVLKGKRVKVPTFNTNAYSGPTNRRVGSINFGISNQIEAKLKSKDTTAAKPGEKRKPKFEKKSLLNNLAIGGSYDIYADSNKLSNIGINANTTLFGKLSVVINGTLDPYQYVTTSNAEGRVVTSRRVKNFAYNTGGGLGNITFASLALSTTLDPKGLSNRPVAANSLTNAPGSEQAFIRNDIYRYVDFDIPWTLSTSYNLSYSKTPFLPGRTVQAITAAGDVSLTKKWKIGYNTGYDIVAKTQTITTLDIYRDLHCWQMRLNVTPFGQFRSFNFTINAKASMLQDLKLQRQRSIIDR